MLFNMPGGRASSATAVRSRGNIEALWYILFRVASSSYEDWGLKV